ncbi:MAG: sugar phosphate isomerase/epimerase family protein [Candidatus Latescibacteria bacterium]|jgi:sugar phosphate isomerase/epimerase|nr:sugar phosphate isomerase/epimerase family protein [Candidatus Latescibacterota bacterium]
MYEIAAYLNQEFWDTGDAFGTAGSYGFTSAEIPEMYCPAPEDSESRERLREAIAASGLQSWWHTLPAHNRHFGSTDEALRSENVQRMEWELEFVHDLGWDRFVIHPGSAADETDKRRVYAALEGLQEKAAALGVQLLVENASDPFNGDPYELARLCDEVPGLALAYDCSHAYRSAYCREGRGSMVDHLKIVVPRVRAIQFNDYNGTANCDLGEGLLPWEALLPVVAETPCDTFTIELQTVAETVSSRDTLLKWFG